MIKNKMAWSLLGACAFAAALLLSGCTSVSKCNKRVSTAVDAQIETDQAIMDMQGSQLINTCNALICTIIKKTADHAKAKGIKPFMEVPKDCIPVLKMLEDPKPKGAYEPCVWPNTCKWFAGFPACGNPNKCNKG